MCPVSNAAEKSRKGRMEKIIDDFGKNIVGVSMASEPWAERVVEKMWGEELETVQRVENFFCEEK